MRQWRFLQPGGGEDVHDFVTCDGTRDNLA